MNLRAALLELPFDERLEYDAGSNVFFVDFEGLAVRSQADIERIRAAVDKKLAAVGQKVHGVVDYDRFTIAPELADDYIAMVKGLMDRHCLDVTRYTSSTFLRVKLGDALARGDVAPHLYSSIGGAHATLESA